MRSGVPAVLGGSAVLLTRVRCPESMPRTLPWFFHGSQAWKSHGICQDAPKLFLLGESLEMPGGFPKPREPVRLRPLDFPLRQLPHLLEPELPLLEVVDRWHVAIGEGRAV